MFDEILGCFYRMAVGFGNYFQQDDIDSFVGVKYIPDHVWHSVSAWGKINDG